MNENKCVVCQCGESKHIMGFGRAHVIAAHDPENPAYFVWPYVFCTACRKDCAATKKKFELDREQNMREKNV